MSKSRLRVPPGLPISAVVLLVLGLIANFVIPATATPEQLADNVLLNAIPFILIFVAVILTFITLIVAVASMLNHNVTASVYRLVETASSPASCWAWSACSSPGCLSYIGRASSCCSAPRWASSFGATSCRSERAATRREGNGQVVITIRS